MKKLLFFITYIAYFPTAHSATAEICSRQQDAPIRLNCYDSININEAIKIKMASCRREVDSSNMRLYCYDHASDKSSANIDKMGMWKWIFGKNDLQGMPPTWSIKYTETTPESADVAIITTKEKGRASNDVQSFSLNLSCISGKPGVYIDSSDYTPDASYLPHQLKMTDVWFNGDPQHWRGWVKYGNKVIFSPYDSTESPSDFMKGILSGNDMHATFFYNGEMQSLTFQTKGLDEAIKPLASCFTSIM